MQTPPFQRRPNTRRVTLWGLVFLAGSLLALAGLSWQVLAQQERNPSAMVLSVQGAIGPATMDYVTRAFAAPNSRMPAWSFWKWTPPVA